MTITLKQLRYFDVLARLSHFGRAAEHCSVTQPALSMQIQQLEGALGIHLFERRPKGVRLTQLGMELSPRVRRILTDIDDLRVGAQGAQFAGPLRIGAIPTIAPYLLTPAIPLIRGLRPAQHLQIREAQTHQILRELMHGELDVIILSHTVEDPELECLQLFTDRILMALPASVAIAGRVGRNLLSKVRLLVLEEGHCLRDQVLDYCKRHQMGKIDTLGASNLTTLTQMVSHGLGATMLPELCAYTETQRRHIRLTRLPAPEPKRELHLVWRVASPRRRDYVELRKLLLAARPKMPSVSRH